jgi:hypothetical protein
MRSGPVFSRGCASRVRDCCGRVGLPVPDRFAAWPSAPELSERPERPDRCELSERPGRPEPPALGAPACCLTRGPTGPPARSSGDRRGRSAPEPRGRSRSPARGGGSSRAGRCWRGRPSNRADGSERERSERPSRRSGVWPPLGRRAGCLPSVRPRSTPPLPDGVIRLADGSAARGLRCDRSKRSASAGRSRGSGGGLLITTLGGSLPGSSKPDQRTKHFSGATCGDPAEVKMSGGDLLSHAVPRAVPSALRGLASGFGMGPGVSLLLWPPKRYRVISQTFELQPDRISGTAQWTRSFFVVKPSAY